MSDNDASLPTDGAYTGTDTLTVWPSTGPGSVNDTNIKGMPIGPPTMSSGWGDYNLEGYPSPQYGLFTGKVVRIVLNKFLEDGDVPGWAVATFTSPWSREPFSAARDALSKGLSLGLPDPNRPAVIALAKLDVSSEKSSQTDRLIVSLPLNYVTDTLANALPASGGQVDVKWRVTDTLLDGMQYVVVMGGKPMSVPIVDAQHVISQSPWTKGENVENVYSAPIVPGYPNLVLTVSNVRLSADVGNDDVEGVIVGQGNYRSSGYTTATNNRDVIVRFPADSGVAPVYISTIQGLTKDNLTARQQAETQAHSQAVARDALYAKAGVKIAPTYTSTTAKAGTTALAASSALALGRAPGAMQLSTAGRGVMTLAGDVVAGLEAAVGRAIAALAASAVGPVVAAASTILFSPSAGEGSDKVPAWDTESMFALNAQVMAGSGVKITPGVKSVNLPARASLVVSNGTRALQIVKTGNGVSATVPVLSAVRDAKTGLDKITVPAVAGAPARTILVNPVPVASTPTNTGNQSPAPVTPVNTGTQVKPVPAITVTTFPKQEGGSIQDFIYWQPSADGSNVEPVYVVLSSPYGLTNTKGKYSGRSFNKDNAGGPILDLDWRTAVIDRAGIDKVKLHTGRFGASPDNTIMINRLEQILKGTLKVTDIDKRFYTHEIRELERYRNLGVKDGKRPVNEGEVWNNTHSATLEDYKINEREEPLYTDEANEAFEKSQEIK